MSEQLKPCPCGEVPEALNIETAPERGGKWGEASGSCCGMWQTSFRLNYCRPESPEAQVLATKAWNSAPRSKE